MPDGMIRSLSCEGQGEGAVRHLVTARGVEISEKLDLLDRDSGIIRLSIIDPLPWGMLSYSAVAQLEALGEHCRLEWRGTFELVKAGNKADALADLLVKSYKTMFRGIREALASSIDGKNNE